MEKTVWWLKLDFSSRKWANYIYYNQKIADWQKMPTFETILAIESSSDRKQNMSLKYG